MFLWGYKIHIVWWKTSINSWLILTWHKNISISKDQCVMGHHRKTSQHHNCASGETWTDIWGGKGKENGLPIKWPGPRVLCNSRAWENGTFLSLCAHTARSDVAEEVAYHTCGKEYFHSLIDTALIWLSKLNNWKRRTINSSSRKSDPLGRAPGDTFGWEGECHGLMSCWDGLWKHEKGRSAKQHVERDSSEQQG